MELLEGVWLYELAELDGIHKADVEKVKAFASRQVDRGRMAYGRIKEEHPRACTFWGTTNKDQYLRDETGNKRFLPVKTSKIDLEALRRDRDQLWAESVLREAEGVSIVLPESLWEEAAVEQEKRVTVSEGMKDILASDLLDIHCVVVEGYQRIMSKEVATKILGISPDRYSQAVWLDIGKCMRALGWEGPMTMDMGNNNKQKGYQRKATPEQLEASQKPASGGAVARMAGYAVAYGRKSLDDIPF